MKKVEFQSKQVRIFIMAVCAIAIATTMILVVTAFCGATKGAPPTNDDFVLVTVPDETSEESSKSEWQPDEADVEYIAKTLYGECVGVKSDTEKAAVVWCILNRVDYKGYACGTSVEYVITFPNQFLGYSPDNPVLDSLKNLAIDVMCRWNAEKEGEADVGRVLPAEYIYFVGNGKTNYFSKEYLSTDYWDFSLESPYEN